MEPHEHGPESPIIGQSGNLEQKFIEQQRGDDKMAVMGAQEGVKRVAAPLDDEVPLVKKWQSPTALVKNCCGSNQHRQREQPRNPAVLVPRHRELAKARVSCHRLKMVFRQQGPPSPRVCRRASGTFARRPRCGGSRPG